MARWESSRLIPLAQEMRVIRLGAGVGRTGRLSEQAMARAEAVFREYQDIIESHCCRKVQCVATSAFREAANRDQLHRRLQDATGYDLIQISGWVNGATLTAATLRQILARCTALPCNQRLKLPGLHPGRAEVIIAGGMILQAVMQRFNLDRLTVSDRGLRWGVVREMVAQEG